MRNVLTICYFLVTVFAFGQQPFSEDKAAIELVMSKQEQCWNKGDIDCFMEGYWKSDSLQFIGSRGLTYGWQQTLDNYKKSYPDKAAMGQLQFDILSMKMLSPENVLLIGKWHLSRSEKEDLGGHFSLNWMKNKR